MARRRWTRFSIGRAAVLAKLRASRQQIIAYYLRRYGRQWHIHTEAEMERFLFSTKRGLGISPGKLFQGKTPEQIRQTYNQLLQERIRTRAKISAAKKGKTIPPETRAKISAAKKGKKRGPPTPETRAKISAAKRRYWAIIRNEILRLARERKIVTAIEPRAIKGQKKILATKRTPETMAVEKERNKIIRECMESLRPDQQALLNKIFQENKTIEQAATELGQTPEKAKEQYEKAIRQLAENKKMQILL